MRTATVAGRDTGTATDGTAGIRLIADNPVDAVFINMLMPGMSGMGVLKHLQRTAAEIKAELCVAVVAVGPTSVCLRRLDFGSKPRLENPIFKVDAV